MIYSVCSSCLHGKRVEAPIHHGYGTGDEAGCIGHEVVNRATQFLRLPHAAKGRLAYNIFTPRSIAAISMGKQRAVLLGKEESGSNGVHADAFTKLTGTLAGHVLGKVADAGLCRSIATHAGQRAESGHRGEVDDASLAGRHHGLQKHLSRYHGAQQVEINHLLELFRVKVEEGLVGTYSGSLHVAPGCVEQGIYSSILAQDGLPVVFQEPPD